MIRAEERENNDKLIREDSFEGTIAKLGGVDKEKVYEQLLKQKVEIVLTAHPTEVNRRTILRKHRTLSEALSKLEGKELSHFERAQTEAELKRTIASIWGSDEIRRKKPDPQMEAEAGIAIIESTLWDAVPSHCRKLDAEVLRDLGKKMPPDSIPVKFASWIGGDRDGNPNVTPLVTKEVMLTLRKRAAMLLSKEMKELYDDLAISRKFSPEMDKLADRIINSHDNLEKYRRVTGHLKERLDATTKYCKSELQRLAETGEANPGGVGIAAPDLWDDLDAQPIFDGEELKNALMIMYDSLVKTGFEDVADGKLKDAIRR
jgi:phosphoenolpyruvate carboxylase